MSAYVLSEQDIRILTQATDAALRLNQKYSASYVLSDSTIELLGKYAGDLHNLYRSLFITNIKAVNGRYGENEKTLPRFKPLREWFFRDAYEISSDRLRRSCELFSEYMYQIAEDPICGTPIFKAFADIHGLLAKIYVNNIRCEEREKETCSGWY